MTVLGPTHVITVSYRLFSLQNWDNTSQTVVCASEASARTTHPDMCTRTVYYIVVLCTVCHLLYNSKVNSECAKPETVDEFTNGICGGAKECLCGDNSDLMLDVTTNDNVFLQCGVYLDKENMTTDKFKKFVIKLPNAISTKRYAVLMIDPNAPSGTFLHLIKSDVSGDDLDGSTSASFDWTRGDVVYAPPTPPAGSGKHRYQLYVFVHTANIKVNSQASTARSVFDFANFMTTNNLCGSLIAGFQFEVENAYTSSKCSLPDCKRECGRGTLCVWPTTTCDGNITDKQVVSPTESPTLTFNTARADKFYYLLMLTVSPPNNVSIAWVISNIRGENLKKGTKIGDELVRYRIPPKTFVISLLLVEQVSDELSPDIQANLTSSAKNALQYLMQSGCEFVKGVFTGQLLVDLDYSSIGKRGTTGSPTGSPAGSPTGSSTGSPPGGGKAGASSNLGTCCSLAIAVLVSAIIA